MTGTVIDVCVSINLRSRLIYFVGQTNEISVKLKTSNNKFKNYTTLIKAIMRILPYYIYFNHNCSLIFRVQHENLYEELISSKWYLWPRECKIALTLLLNSAMSPSTVNVLGVLPLNVNTFLIVSLLFLINTQLKRSSYFSI